ncbi:MAG: hypothetical protein RIF34_03820, partial [Candidatus Kapaibacterium sp.]
MNKYIYTLLFLLISSFCFSQSGKFNEIKQTIEQKININLWDEVLILAPDLIIEEPTKGDGYYYTALAFQRLGNEDKAKKY